MTPRPYTKAQIFGYLEYFKGEGLPLIVFVSGYSQGGNGGSELTRLNECAIPMLIKNGKWASISGDRFNVVAVQETDNIINADLFHQFIKNMKALYKTETVYLTGLSAGAITIWNYLERHAQDKEIKAVIPIAGNGNNAVKYNLQAVSEIPIWAFHGEKDDKPATKLGAQLNPIKTIRLHNPLAIAKITVYTGCGHNAWNKTYDLTGMKSITTYDPYDVSIYDWLLKY